MADQPIPHSSEPLTKQGGVNEKWWTYWKQLFAPDAVEAAITARVATQAEQEAGSSLTQLVVSGRQHLHQSAAKTWSTFNASGVAAASYNTTSITDNGTGSFTVNIATDFSSANYSALVSLLSGTNGFTAQVGSKSAGTTSVAIFNSSAVAADPTSTEFSAFGDQ